MSAHTPGPWRLHRSSVKAASATVANIVTGWGTRDDEDAANARLIAAAPRMLEALKRIAGLWQNDGRTHSSNPNFYYDMDFAYDKIRAILRDVEGESHG